MLNRENTIDAMKVLAPAVLTVVATYFSWLAFDERWQILGMGSAVFLISQWQIKELYERRRLFSVVVLGAGMIFSIPLVVIVAAIVLVAVNN
jgi:hypothetical protein